VSARLLADEELSRDTLREVEFQLYRLRHTIPAGPLKKLQEVPIWLELNNWERCQYHPSRDWLAAHNYNPDKAGAVEVSNARSFLSWVRERGIFVLLHELAHAHHHRVLGHDNRVILDAYEKARASGVYESVLRDTGGKVRHYAMENAQEYFAELTESYFARNDYFPFIRVELQQFDPTGYEMCRKLWEE
jgi:hypothetical protein